MIHDCMQVVMSRELTDGIALTSTRFWIPLSRLPFFLLYFLEPLPFKLPFL